MRGLRLFVASLFVLGLSIAGCESQPPTPTLDPSLISALAPACAGQLVAGAGSVSTSSGSLNHMIVLNTSGEAFDWTEWAPTEWRPVSVADTELVTCVTPQGRAVIEVCPYVGSDVTRYSASRAFTVFEPSSGERVAHFSIVAEPRHCFPTEIASLTALEGTIDQSVVTAHLASLVEHGAFVDPDAAGPTQEPSQSSEPSVRGQEVELRQALADGLVSVTGAGDGLQKLDLELTSEVDRALEVTIEPGTLLEPRARGTQTMVVVSRQVLELSAGETKTVTLDVACTEMHRGQPTGEDSFHVIADKPSADLLRLLATPDLAAVSGRVEQFAIWTITDNPKRNGYVGLTSAFEVFGSGPDDNEIAAIRDLFDAAGIDSGKYRALR